MSKPKINDITIIERCILRSKYIIMAQSAQQTRKEMDLFFNRFPTHTLVSKDHLLELDKEIFVLIDGFKRDIGKFLKPIFHAHDIKMGYESKNKKQGWVWRDLDKFWFSAPELKVGYIELSTRQMAPYGIHDRILPLSTVEIGSEKISAGHIITWTEFKKFENSIPSVLDKTFITHYSLRKLKNHDKDRNSSR